MDALIATTDDLRAAHRWALGHDLELAVRLLAPLFWYAEFRTAEMLDWAQRTVEAADRAAFTHPVGAENRVTVSDQRLRGWPTSTSPSRASPA